MLGPLIVIIIAFFLSPEKSFSTQVALLVFAHFMKCDSLIVKLKLELLKRNRNKMRQSLGRGGSAQR